MKNYKKCYKDNLEKLENIQKQLKNEYKKYQKEKINNDNVDDSSQKEITNIMFKVLKELY